MVPFTYRCPRTGQQVQGWATDDLADGETYEPMTCTACGRVHLVNRKSGKVLETENKERGFNGLFVLIKWLAALVM